VIVPEVPPAYRRLLSDGGKVRRWPAKEREKRFVLEYLQSKFAEGRTYSEAEVNEVLLAWHGFDDPALLRRELFERRLMDRTRDGRSYWREPKPHTD
jgi:hypothetical protein